MACATTGRTQPFICPHRCSPHAADLSFSPKGSVRVYATHGMTLCRTHGTQVRFPTGALQSDLSQPRWSPRRMPARSSSTAVGQGPPPFVKAGQLEVTFDSRQVSVRRLWISQRWTPFKRGDPYNIALDRASGPDTLTDSLGDFKGGNGSKPAPQRVALDVARPPIDRGGGHTSPRFESDRDDVERRLVHSIPVSCAR